MGKELYLGNCGRDIHASSVRMVLGESDGIEGEGSWGFLLRKVEGGDDLQKENLE